MDKSQIIALLYLIKNDTNQLQSLDDYIKQFEVIEENVRGILENRKKEL